MRTAGVAEDTVMRYRDTARREAQQRLRGLAADAGLDTEPRAPEHPQRCGPLDVDRAGGAGAGLRPRGHRPPGSPRARRVPAGQHDADGRGRRRSRRADLEPGNPAELGRWHRAAAGVERRLASNVAPLPFLAAFHRQRGRRAVAHQRPQPGVVVGSSRGAGGRRAAGGAVPGHQCRHRGDGAPGLGAQPGHRRGRPTGRLRVDVRDAGQRHGPAGHHLRALLPVGRRPRRALLFAAAGLHGRDAGRRRVGQSGAAGGVLGADQRLLVPAHRLLDAPQGRPPGRPHGLHRHGHRRPGAAGRRANDRPHRRQPRARRRAALGRRGARTPAVPAWPSAWCCWVR